MDFLSLAYILFICLLMLLYYALPRLVKGSENAKWGILLLASILFYLMSGPANLVFLLLTSLSVWYGARRMSSVTAALKETLRQKSPSREEKKALRAKAQKKKKRILSAVLILNFGILAWLKYSGSLFPAGTMTFGKFLLPIGISFYTFQACGYLIDIYGAKYEAEASFPRFLLFISWFPQLIQGPINRYDRMKDSLFTPHSFDRERTVRALLLILFGLMKKYAVADMLSGHISAVLDRYVSQVPGCMIITAILMYSIQQYADFSGGIDVVLGVSSLFGVEMMPNFRQPYFAVSLGDFWRRWHISLGAWMRDYVFYPFALTKPMQRFGKWCSKFGKHFGRVMPACIANILVFFIVGIWHGSELHYIVWGLYNGLVIALSDLTAPVWENIGAALKLPAHPKGLHLFRILRTFIIVNIGWYFDRITDTAEAFRCLARSLTAFSADEFGIAFRNCIISEGGGAFTALGSLGTAAAGTVLVFVFSLLKEKGRDPMDLQRKPLFVYAMLMLVLISFVFTTNAGGFLYANF